MNVGAKRPHFCMKSPSVCFIRLVVPGNGQKSCHLVGPPRLWNVSHSESQSRAVTAQAVLSSEAFAGLSVRSARGGKGREDARLLPPLAAAGAGTAVRSSAEPSLPEQPARGKYKVRSRTHARKRAVHSSTSHRPAARTPTTPPVVQPSCCACRRG